MTAEAGQARTLWRLPGEHLGLLLTFGGFALALTRLLFVSGGNLAIALTLLSTLDLQALLMATFATVLPFALLFLGLVAPSRRLPFGPHADEPWHANAAALLAVLGLALIPIGSWLSLGAALVLAYLWWRLRSRKRGMSLRSSLLNDSLSVLLIAIVFSTVLNRAMWLPSESVLIGTQAPRTAYVLSEGETTVLLYNEPREVERLSSSHVKDRQYCSLGAESFLSRGLFSFLLPDVVSPPRCPAG